MDEKRRIEHLLEDRDTGIFFQILCENGPDALRAQAWQFRPHFDKTEGPELDATRDALLELAYELLPDSPAGTPETLYEAKRELFGKAVRWLHAQGMDVTEALPAEAMNEAWELPLPDFRAYLRARCEAVRRVA
jgi:hypothetical protein